MEDKSSKEGRGFTRIPMKMEVTITVSGEAPVTLDQVKDVSMKGLYLLADKTLPEGTECDVVMSIGEPGSQLNIEVKGKVDRSSDSGMAIEFTEIGLESYDHLQNLLLYNSKNAPQVEQEFKNHLGLLKRSD